jgi:type IV secretory pathway VirB2 component (pilin)
MMDQMGGMMMWGMGLIWFLLVIVLILAAAALVKYLVSKNR